MGYRKRIEKKRRDESGNYAEFARIYVMVKDKHINTMTQVKYELNGLRLRRVLRLVLKIALEFANSTRPIHPSACLRSVRACRRPHSPARYRK